MARPDLRTTGAIPPSLLARLDRQSIHLIIDERDLRVIFQPIVHLATGDIIGIEAFARGPKGTIFESPKQLFGAAKAAGRLAELDWACRAAVANAILERNLPEALTVFVNIEADVLGQPCPPDLEVPITTALAKKHPFVIELSPGSLKNNPSPLPAISALRNIGYRVALDNVGGDPASGPLVTVSRPDIIKLHSSVSRDTQAQASSLMNAIRDYAEHSGALIVAEGIETREQANNAKALGATYGQGWFYGYPMPLPEHALNSVQALPSTRPGSWH